MEPASAEPALSPTVMWIEPLEPSDPLPLLRSTSPPVAPDPADSNKSPPAEEVESPA